LWALRSTTDARPVVCLGVRLRRELNTSAEAIRGASKDVVSRQVMATADRAESIDIAVARCDACD
jgi:hypothetical protein